MNADKLAAVKAMMDFIYHSCRFDSSGKDRPDDEKLQKFVWYIGWLEGNLLSLCDDDEAEILLSRVEVWKAWSKQDATDEALLHDDQDGSFY